MRRIMWVAGTLDLPALLRLPALLGLLALLGICSGCKRERDETPVELDGLPYLHESQYPELRAELARLEAEQATPRLLDASRPTPADVGAAKGGSAKARALLLIRELNDICPMQDLRLTSQRVARFYPVGEFQFDPINLALAREIGGLLATQLEEYHKLFHRDGFQFDVSLTDGLLADLSLLDHATYAHRLDALFAADVLATGQPDAALLAFRNMLMIDSQLAAVPNVSARRCAARLRTEALEVAAAMVKHPQCSQTLRKEMLKILETELENWTPDKVAWVGDRALGVHTYEMVRDGQLMSILTAEEIAELKGERKLVAFEQAIRQSLDEDEWFYLSTMRRVIDGCDKPFFERIALFDDINQEVEELRDTQHFPLFATNVLLPDLASVHREQAIDRAHCEAWVMALRAAEGMPVDSQSLSPVTGKPYRLKRDLDSLVVSEIAGERSDYTIVVPTLPE